MAKINNIRDKMIQKLLSNPDDLLQKRPFTRSGHLERDSGKREVNSLETQRVTRPTRSKIVVTQETYLDELDPSMHKVLFDENVPHICIKTDDGGYREIEYRKMALPYQINIKDKKVLHLCANPMNFTLMEKEPTDEDVKSFVTFKSYWNLRNQEGIKTKFVDAQLSMGDAGILYYFDYKGEIKSRLICYKDGYTLCPHNDPNGDRLLESIYYVDDEGTETIETYSDTTHYKHILKEDENGDNEWVKTLEELHGFSEIPLVTKRGEVAWERAQSLIEALETLWNTFVVVQKRHGWGILYVKGKITQADRSIAGNIIMQDTTNDHSGEVEFKTPPTPEHMIETLKELKYEIQTAGGATFILPQDIKMSGDVSAVAIQLSQSLDNEGALKGISEWQNVASKMCRLFKEGLSIELVNKGIDSTAVTKYDKMTINAKFSIWLPKSEDTYNQMLATLKGAGLISQKTAIENNTQSKPDEEYRIKLEEAEEQAKLLEEAIATNDASVVDVDDTSDDNDVADKEEN